MANLEKVWNEAISYRRYVDESEKNKNLWEGVYRLAKIPFWAQESACAVGREIRLLVIAEDWCGDASNTVPYLARLGDENDCLEMRVVRRDEYPELMDHYLTNGSRSIPIVIAIDADFNEVGHWGPRPAELQQWVMDNKDRMPSDERYKHVRRWYAKDKGTTTLKEVLALFDGIGEQARGLSA